jgi:hypothetical protein
MRADSRLRLILEWRFRWFIFLHVVNGLAGVLFVNGVESKLLFAAFALHRPAVWHMLNDDTAQGSAESVRFSN